MVMKLRKGHLILTSRNENSFGEPRQLVRVLRLNLCSYNIDTSSFDFSDNTPVEKTTDV